MAPTTNPGYWSVPEKHGWEGIWMNHPAVRARINRRVTGDATVWPIQWLPSVVPGRTPFPKALSIGSGLGHFERSLVDHGIARCVVGVDLGGEALDEARRRAAAAGLGDRIEYVAADARAHLAAARNLDA